MKRNPGKRSLIGSKDYVLWERCSPMYAVFWRSHEHPPRMYLSNFSHRHEGNPNGLKIDSVKYFTPRP